MLTSVSGAVIECVWGDVFNRKLRTGIPTLAENAELLASTEFLYLETFSNEFLAKNKEILKPYERKWVADPLHQWSRQWEYSFVFSRLCDLLKARGTEKTVLDAGAGMSFFPFLLQTDFPEVDMHCCDYDPVLDDIYRQINASMGTHVNFTNLDMRSLRYGDDFFDAVYSVSVLEHTDNYEAIIQELFRVIKPGGQLMITFDVSIDRNRDISPEQGDVLLRTLEKYFISEDKHEGALGSAVLSSDILTTLAAKETNPESLPWRYPAILYQVQSMLKGRGFCAWPPNVTLYCASFRKPG